MSEMAAPHARSSYLLGNEELTLLLKYQCLPANQQGVILVAMAGLNAALLTSVRNFQWRRRDLDFRPELHITSVHRSFLPLSFRRKTSWW
jgi:hypothetical protein